MAELFEHPLKNYAYPGLANRIIWGLEDDGEPYNGTPTHFRLRLRNVATGAVLVITTQPAGQGEIQADMGTHFVWDATAKAVTIDLRALIPNSIPYGTYTPEIEFIDGSENAGGTRWGEQPKELIVRPL